MASVDWLNLRSDLVVNSLDVLNGVLDNTLDVGNLVLDSRSLDSKLSHLGDESRLLRRRSRHNLLLNDLDQMANVCNSLGEALNLHGVLLDDSNLGGNLLLNRAVVEA